MSNNTISPKAQRLNQLLTRANAARGTFFRKCKTDQEKYFNDVDNTLTNFTQNQLDEIDSTYSIPVNTKISYPIVEQLISFLTATKPYPRLLSTTETTQEFTESYSEAYQGTWYENKGLKQLRYAIRDMLTAGRGYIRVRKNSFFEETTFNTVIEHIDWKRVFLDPEGSKDDLSDAEYLVVCSVRRKSRAEKELGVKISSSHGDDRSSISQTGLSSDDLGQIVQDWLIDNANGAVKQDQYVLIKEFYERKDLNVFISENGQVSTARPRPFEANNPDRIEMEQQMMEVQNAINELQQGTQDMEQVEPDMQSEDMLQAQEQNQQIEGQVQQLTAALQEMQKAYAQMPKKVTMYHFILETGEEIVVREVERVVKKRVHYTLMAGDTILDEEWLDMSRYPVIQFPFNWKNATRCYSLLHQIEDLVNAMDKYISLMMLDLAQNGARKVLYPEGAILETSDIETRWSQPGSWIEYKPQPQLDNNGKPEVVEPSTVSQSMVYFVDKFLSLIEYVTGLYGVMQGNPEDAPSTYSATNSMQNFGSQRIKQYSRSLEHCLEDLAYVVVSFLQQYAPKDKILKYFNDEDEPTDVVLMSDTRDLTFKVRVSIASSLPTSSQAAAQMLGNIAQTSGDPLVASLLTQFSLELIDLPQGKKWAKQLDVMKRMQEQIAQLEEQVQQTEAQNRALENNITQKETAHKIDLAAEKAKGEIKTKQAEIETGMDNAVVPEDNQTIDMNSILQGGI